MNGGGKIRVRSAKARQTLDEAQSSCEPEEDGPKSQDRKAFPFLSSPTPSILYVCTGKAIKMTYGSCPLFFYYLSFLPSGFLSSCSSSLCPRVDSVTEDSTTTASSEPRPATVPPQKTLVSRESILTNLLKVEHFRALYNLALGLFTLLSTHVIVNDLLKLGARSTWELHIGRLTWYFAGMPQVLVIWTGMLLSAGLVPFYAFYAWVRLRARQPDTGEEGFSKAASHGSLMELSDAMIRFSQLSS
ncbi:unnamed protein product [Protopolystoma xenopodis]|uniref:Uncharacterized protein n=1 Tax=Protopolystoma xenopodis TaxID=117903 RepID=A0A3S5CL99_9PLAT|nr:unnamed protein product [Protopolystoma xenopodis]